MTTTSEVKSSLDSVAETIQEHRSIVKKAISNAALSSAALSALATIHAGMISTVQAYTGVDSFETLAKDELARLTAEFQALKADADAVAAVDLAD